ncbi:hypothetical protein AAFF27_14150 [Xylophilus sp. GW821-FHT01B05]
MSAPPVAPRFVPTLTEVVDWQPEDAVPAPPPEAPEPTVDTAAVLALEEGITAQVLERVDQTLSGRLSDAITLVVLEQTRFMLPRLREEIAEAVRRSVEDAVRQELGGTRSAGDS